MATTVERVTEAVEALRALRSAYNMWENNGFRMDRRGDGPNVPAPLAEAVARADRFFDEGD